ncbi:MAG: hypothetical protein V4751_04860 [Pseudomonadota bacterium]
MHSTDSSARTETVTAQRRLWQIALTVLALTFLFAAFVIPNRLSWVTPLSFAYLPLEVFVFGLLLLVPGHSGLVIRWLAALLLGAGVIFRIADMSAFMVFARPFNPVLDTYLLADGFHLLTTSIGLIGAVVASILLAALAVVIILLSWFALGRARALLLLVPPQRAGVVLLAGLVLWTGLFFTGVPRVSKYFYDQLAMHVSNTRTSLAELRSFREVVNIDAYADVPGESLFGALRGKDVLVVFVESYGRIVIDSEHYSPFIRPALQQATATLEAQGFEARSGFLTSPTVGGISWLAHGTALSGMWIDSQIRYDSLMISERPSLVRLFNRAGWRTLGVMPAITMAWPEGQYFGYDHVYDARELAYQGKPFNYVTMPDQFTLAQFQKLERTPGERQPVMAEIALISSHAPWTPVPELIDWRAVGDGSEFNEQATSDDPPEVVWQERQRVLDHYRGTIDYELQTLVSYATTFGDENLVMLILGDHQPMPYVTDETENRDVLVHLIAKDPKVLEAVADWQWTDGMLPADDAPVWRMDEVRDRFIEAFSVL